MKILIDVDNGNNINPSLEIMSRQRTDYYKKIEINWKELKKTQRFQFILVDFNAYVMKKIDLS